MWKSVRHFLAAKIGGLCTLCLTSGRILRYARDRVHYALVTALMHRARHTMKGMEAMSTQGTPGRSREPVETVARQAVTPVEPCCVLPRDGKSATKELFELKQVADGVYAAIAAPQYKINSNAAVILTNDGAIVVDSHSKPSAARALFREIQGITTQPVHTLINTHFHWDHWQGNEVYAAATAHLEIISSARTQENLLTPGAGVGGVPYIAPQLAALPTEIAQLKDEIRRAGSPDLKARLETNLQQTEAYLAELQQLAPALPTRTVASSVTLHEHGRELQLLLLGRAHTDGDLFIYLPQEKVIVTGDTVVDWMPFLGDGYPEEWIETLNALEQVDFTHMIPGHGDVLPMEQKRTIFQGHIRVVEHCIPCGKLP